MVQLTNINKPPRHQSNPFQKQLIWARGKNKLSRIWLQQANHVFSHERAICKKKSVIQRAGDVFSCLAGPCWRQLLRKGQQRRNSSRYLSIEFNLHQKHQRSVRDGYNSWRNQVKSRCNSIYSYFEWATPYKGSRNLKYQKGKRKWNH